MDLKKGSIVESPAGQRPLDSSGSPIGVARLDPARSYSGIGGLLQRFINDSDAEAWEQIKFKINYTYDCLDFALGTLEKETGFSRLVKSKVGLGQKLLFKPNLVNPFNINPQHHGPDMGSTTCTEWPFLAALMRWFHDRLGVSYHQMALGEAATAMPAVAALLSRANPDRLPITPEAVMEGKSGTFYGGWGFYFVRKYLKEMLSSGADEDPFRGYEESISGAYLPPGLAEDRLLVYDLNRIFDRPDKGRELAVPDGVNFKSIILHKAVVGGDPKDPEDRKNYPGCILINVPKLKVHAITLFTNAIKNLGIGLYPMQSSRSGSCKWDYSCPPDVVPGMKGLIPHEPWVGEIDPQTGFPPRDVEGRFILKKTGGISATMVDIIQAVRNQGISMVHIVDAIEAINLDHQGMLPGQKEPEGLVFAGLDPVALDLLCARYLFSNVPLKEAMAVNLDDGFGGKFPQRVPVPHLQENQIQTRLDYDCPLSRDHSLKEAADRGLGQSHYYVVGKDLQSGEDLASIEGHLGRVGEHGFSEVNTERLYFDIFKLPWDLQKTFLGYLKSGDQLTGSSKSREFLEAFDENQDGIVAYEEYGRKWIWGFFLNQGGHYMCQVGKEELGYLRGLFQARAGSLKCADPQWNGSGFNFLKEYQLGGAALAALRMSQMEMEVPDFFQAGLVWGKGKWPSFQTAWFSYLGFNFYGDQFPFGIKYPSLFSAAFHYADLTQNSGRYTGLNVGRPDPAGISAYISDVFSKKENPLDFTFYVPPGFDLIAGNAIPNVEATTEPQKMITASFNGGQEVWCGSF